ncbi:MAG: sulfotransferase [Colwellia sp.]|nr:sulfotransferase [Colwellia sp.]
MNDLKKQNLQEDKKLKIIYIASNGRSGSTLLEMMLAAHTSIETLGEIQRIFIDHDNFRQEQHDIVAAQSCGCGCALKNCEFWADIIVDLKKTTDYNQVGLFRSKPYLQGKALRIGILNNLRKIKQNKTNPYKGNISKYNEANNSLYSKSYNRFKVLKNNSSFYMVDASKDPYRLAWLLQSQKYDIHVLHIIKECPSYVYSMIKHEESLVTRNVLFFKKVLRWVVENIIITWVCDNFLEQNRYCSIRYENLASNPTKTMNEICRRLDIIPESDMVKNFRKKQHGISGNQMRMEDKSIMLDRKWETQLARPLKFIAMLIQTTFSSKVYNHESK